MKRIVIMLVSLGLVLVSLGSAEAGRSTRVARTVQGSYGLYTIPVTGCNVILGQDCFSVETRPTEAFFAASVADAHGQPVLVHVWAYPRRDASRHVASFCGKTRRPLAMPPGATLSFSVAVSHNDTPLPCPERAVKTTGTITVTLSNRP